MHNALTTAFRGGSFLLIAAVLLAAPAFAADRQPPRPAPKDKCPVCGMFVARYPDWTAQAVHEDGRVLFFDGPKDLFKYLAEPGRYTAGSAPAAVRSVWVKDYYSLASFDAREAFFVAGSDVIGPMGRELVPFRKRGDADNFRKDHHGERILRFRDITADILQQLDR